MAALEAESFFVSEPPVRAAPFVFASPHSGRLYPARFLKQSRLGGLNLRRSEDAYIDELFAAAAAIGAPLIAARFPRAFLDANRNPAELDPLMFAGPLGLPVDSASPRVLAGLGVIPRIVRDGAEIYRDKLEPHEARQRLERFHCPYHAALGRLVEDTRARFGMAIVIDCHSMPSVAAAPDIVLGDRYGLAAAPAVTRAAERAFEQQGFRPVRNVPYAGGYTTQIHGRPARGVHALQIEINRSLYLDEERIALAPGFAELADRIAAAIRRFAALAEALWRSPVAHAAE